MSSILSIQHLYKTYDSGFNALEDINLEINRGEIIALLGPNGAGKTTLISIICGLVNPTSGAVAIDGNDIIRDFRAARALAGLVPQELTTESFETVLATLKFSRGLFGNKPDDAHLEKVLKSLSLWEKRHSRIMTLSGGMKRRLLIAKALAHEPRVLFLDEPTAGVDVELRKETWAIVQELKESGVTIILTTHYIDEAEQMADRIAVINHGEIILVDDKKALMEKMGSKDLVLHLQEPLEEIPTEMKEYELKLSEDGQNLNYTYNVQARDEDVAITAMLDAIEQAGIHFRDLETRQSTLEEIFVNLVQ
jgi:ABC-2 type transport system ATP-binding protein